ncbi:hypothetical protein JCM3774_001957 [Rhodotorula dairenensis]
MSPSLHLHAPHLHHSHPHGNGSPAPTTAYTDASPKGQHYATTLDTIRRLALWTSVAPALAKGVVNWNAAPTTTTTAATGSTAATGTGMEWNEVLRKFRKHNPNRPVTAAAAATERTLQLLLSKAPAPGRPSSSEVASPYPPPLLPPRIASADLATAAEALEELRTTLCTTQGIPIEVDSAKVVLAFGGWASGNADQALADLATVAERGLPRAGMPSEGYDMTLRVLAYAVEGYALESTGRSTEALAAYFRAGELYQAAVDALATGPDRDNNDISLHRTGGDVLMRVALGVRASTATDEPRHLETAYSAHRAYLDRSTTFARSAAAFPVSAQTAMHRSFRSLQTALSRWDPASVSQNDRGQERILRRTTGLPKAGETNREYLQFLDEVVQGWKARGAPRAGVDEVIEILYNALTHTFQSHLLLRHLIRALTIAGRYDEATKALRLYRELWDKARETDAKEVALEMRELRSRAMREAAGAGKGSLSGEKDSSTTPPEKDTHAPDAESESTGLNEPFAVDIDSDAVFIETVVFGVRLLCRYFGERATDAVELAKRAKAVFDQEKDASLKKDGGKVEADLERSLGAALGALARHDPDADRRTKRHSQALDHLRRAVSLASVDPLNLYTLGYHLLEQRRVSEALDCAREAARLDPSMKEAWHLLALCVSAQKDMRGALEVLETAIDLESGDCEDDSARRWDHPTDATERLAVDMQLRLTRNAVIEYLDGPAAALVDQQEILAFFATAYAPIANTTTGAHAAAASTPKSDLNGRASGGLAPPVSGGAVSRAASILSRRRSSKKRMSAAATMSSGSAVGPIPPLHAPPGGTLPSSVASTPARSVVGESTAPSIGTAVSATPSCPARDASTETIAAAVPAGQGHVRPSPASDPVATKVLVDTWLASAASFRRAGRVDEARGAVSEAEALDVDDADVWTQYALVLLAQGDAASDPRDEQRVKDVLTRAMAIDPDHVPMTILTARRFLTPPPRSGSDGDDAIAEAGDKVTDAKVDEDPDVAAPTWQRPLPSDWLVLQVPLAESMLETVVVREGYDVAEAWYELSRCYQLTQRPRQEKECLVRALELERTRPVRVLGKAVQRFV